MESYSEESNINYCEIHTDVQIDHFCSQHAVVCCSECLSDSHSSCESALHAPLDLASKDVKNSSLLSDTLREQEYMIETLEKMKVNRDENEKLLKQKKSLIIQQTSAAKLKYLDEIEERLISLESVQEKNEKTINKEKNEIDQLKLILKNNKQELENLKEHGSNNQLFLTLLKQITIIKKIDKKIHDMTSAINEIDMEFKEITIGSLLQVTRPCAIKYKSMKVQFTKEGEFNLISGEQCHLTDMAVTSDNKLLLCCDSSKVYIYKDYKTYEDEISFASKPYGITAVPETDKAVVTLPQLALIQFINTTNNEKGKKVKVGGWCLGVTAVKDKIYIGTNEKVIILTADGSRLKEITIVSDNKNNNYRILYDERNDQLLLGQPGRLCWINSDGLIIYRYDILGVQGLAVDQQGHVYVSVNDSDNILRLLPDGQFCGIVFSNEDDVHKPVGITFNNDFTKLFIINNGGKTVSLYSCSK